VPEQDTSASLRRLITTLPAIEPTITTANNAM